MRFGEYIQGITHLLEKGNVLTLELATVYAMGPVSYRDFVLKKAEQEKGKHESLIDRWESESKYGLSKAWPTTAESRYMAQATWLKDLPEPPCSCGKRKK